MSIIGMEKSDGTFCMRHANSSVYFPPLVGRDMLFFNFVFYIPHHVTKWAVTYLTTLKSENKAYATAWNKLKFKKEKDSFAISLPHAKWGRKLIYTKLGIAY